MDRDDSEIEHREVDDDKDSPVVEHQDACKTPVGEYQENTDNPAVEYEEDKVPAHFDKEKEKRQSRELTEIGKQKHLEALEKVKLHSKAPQRPKHRFDLNVKEDNKNLDKIRNETSDQSKMLSRSSYDRCSTPELKNVTANKFDGSKSINCQPMKEYPNEKRFDPADVMDSEEKEEPMEIKPSNEVSDVLYGLDSIRLKEENRVQTDVHMLPPSTNHGNDQTCNRRGRCEDNYHRLPEGFQMQSPSCASGLLEYSMTSNPRGIGVVINNCKFNDSKSNNLPNFDREGAHLDTEALVPFLKSMRFDVRSFKDLSAVQIRMILTEIANLNHEQYDCLVCCICSHGRGNSLLGSDCSEISVEAVRSIFRIEKCPSLSGKPKIFFIQACNGQNLEGIQLAQTYQEDSFPDSIKPAKSDELIGYSTVDDHASFRHPLEGSVYIQTLVKYMKDLRQTTELCQILTKVNQKVGDQFMPLKDGLVGKQMPRYESTLMKLLYLKD